MMASQVYFNVIIMHSKNILLLNSVLPHERDTNMYMFDVICLWKTFYFVGFTSTCE